MRPTLIRNFITLAILTQQGSGAISPAELESLCHLEAQRLALLREFNAPEFFDKAIFRTFIDTLTENGYASVRDDGKIEFGQRLNQTSDDARHVLPADVRRAILHMTRQDAGKAAGVLASAAGKPSGSG